jgi:hypothetical protein
MNKKNLREELLFGGIKDKIYASREEGSFSCGSYKVKDLGFDRGMLSILVEYTSPLEENAKEALYHESIGEDKERRVFWLCLANHLDDERVNKV